jgi:ribonuclease HI
MPKRRRTVVAKPKKTASRARKSTVAQGAAPLAGRVIERADGFYWERVKGEAHGPYASLAEAEAEMLADGAAAEDEELEVPQALQEAESELGISEWIDPDTGGPAEDNVPRIEDH